MRPESHPDGAVGGGGRHAVACRIRQFFATNLRVSLGDRSDTAIFRGVVLIGENGGGLAVKAGPATTACARA